MTYAQTQQPPSWPPAPTSRRYGKRQAQSAKVKAEIMRTKMALAWAVAAMGWIGLAHADGAVEAAAGAQHTNLPVTRDRGPNPVANAMAPSGNVVTAAPPNGHKAQNNAKAKGDEDRHARAAAVASTLDLVTAFARAVASDPNVAIARARLEADRAGVDIARARLLPSVSASASLGRSRTETDYLSAPRPSTTNDYHSRNAALQLRQPLYRPVDWRALTKAERQVLASEAQLTAAQADLLKRVARAYVRVLSAEAQRKTADSEVTRYEAVLAQAERALKAGAGTRTDVEDARARLDLAIAAQVKAQGELARAREALAALIGSTAEALASQPLAPFADVARLAEELLATPLADWQEAALARNPEIAALAAQIDAARLEVERQRAQHLPTVDVLAQQRHSRSDSETTIGTQYHTTSVAVQVSVPLYAGGGIDASVRAATAAVAEAEARLEAKRRELRQTVADAYQNVRFTLAQWQALAQAERSAHAAVEGSKKGLLAGTRNVVDVLNAEQELARVKAQRLDTAHQLLVAALDVLTAADGGLEAVLARLGDHR